MGSVRVGRPPDGGEGIWLVLAGDLGPFILKGKGNVTGTATAARLWNTGAIGVAVAFLSRRDRSRLVELEFLDKK
jgi:hypothetical protein